MDEELERAVQEIILALNEATNELRSVLTDVLNGIRPPEAITPAIEKIRTVIQPLNNRNVGLAFGVSNFFVMPFSLTGDIKTDLGQKNNTPPDARPKDDEDFLKKLGLRFP